MSALQRNDQNLIIRLSPLKWLGVLEATIGRWSKQTLSSKTYFLKIFPSRKATWSHSARTTSVTAELNPTWPSPPSSSPLCWLLLEAICDKSIFVEKYIVCSYHLSCLQFRTIMQTTSRTGIRCPRILTWTQKRPKTSGQAFTTPVPPSTTFQQGASLRFSS